LKVGIDVTIERINPAGPGHYVRSLLSALDSLPSPPSVETFASGLESFLTMGGQVGSRVHTLYRDLIWIHSILPVIAQRNHLDLLHMPAYTIPAIKTMPVVVTMFDMSVLDRPRDFKTWQRLYLTAMIPIAARRAELIITISHYSKERIHALTGVERSKIVVTPLAARREFRRLPRNELAGHAARELERFILTVGTLEPRKNISGLLQAADQLHKAGIRVPVVHAGPRGWLDEPIFRQVEQMRLQNQVHFLGKVSQRELILLYNRASVFVYPSFYEGFGLPVLEAMACGCPVITSNCTALPEVAGDAALLVNPSDSGDIARAIEQVLSDRDLAENLRQRGLRRASDFTWERCARQTVDAYYKALDYPRHQS